MCDLVAEGVFLVVFTSVVGRVDDPAASRVGAALHLRQVALAVRARGSEFVDFLDAVRAQTEVARLGRWARAARRVCRLPWGAALLAGCFSFAWQPDENQEGKEAEEEAKQEPRAASTPLSPAK